MATGQWKQSHKLLQPVFELTRKQCSANDVAVIESSLQSDPPPITTRVIEYLLVLLLANRFSIKIIIGVTRLGEVFEKTKEKEREFFLTLVCRLALFKTTGHHLDSVELSNLLLQYGHESPNVENTFGLIEFRSIHGKSFSSTGDCYAFDDVTVQIFLTAVYLCTQPIMTTIDFIKKHLFHRSINEHDKAIARNCKEVMQYVFGLADSGLNKNLKEVLPHYVHYMCQFISITDPVVDNEMALLVLACLREAQSRSLCLKVHHDFFKRQIFSYRMTALEDKFPDLGYYLATTTEHNQSWTLYHCSTGENIRMKLEELSANIMRGYNATVYVHYYPELVQYDNERIVISNRNIEHLLSVMRQQQLVMKDEGLHGTTTSSIGTSSQATSHHDNSTSSVYGYMTVEQYESMQQYENVTYFNMVKDLMVTPLQDYSTLPVQAQYRKGDHIWLAGSQNLRFDFYKHVHISPYSALHWVKVKQPDGTREIEDRYEREAMERLRSQSFDAETAEIVLLNSHRFLQISVTPPSGVNPTVISLYGSSDEVEEPGFIGADYLDSAHSAMGDIRWKESRPFDVIGDERIGRELPLPSKRGTESGDMTAATAAILEESTRLQKSPSPTSRPPTSSRHYQRPITSVIRPLGAAPFNEQQVKRLALESFDIPGQCFYSDEDRFKSGQKYTQPHLLTGCHILREGGNGLILEVYIDGQAYAVKRTAFRWREILIMPKLRHKNILRLAAMMMGPPIEGYPRRRYVYHYFPKMTNDLGRLIGSYERYCLRTLKERYRNEKLLLNKIQSNFRYIASELLQGLNYLHTLPNPIIHRDIKPSNILVLTDCDCPNPLACVCRQRPQIVLSDFDASLELTPEGTLIPDPPRSSTQGFYLSSERTYHVSPVGTVGFKSPEGFIHMIGNSADIMPPLSTKADVFSFGLMMLLLVLAEDGPRSMSKMGVLLLSLNKRSNFGRSSLSSVAVTAKDINKILPIDRLRREFSSTFPSLVEFIASSLEIDPHRRASAYELLSHKYLQEQGRECESHSLISSSLLCCGVMDSFDRSGFSQHGGRMILGMNTTQDGVHLHGATSHVQSSPDRNIATRPVKNPIPVRDITKHRHMCIVQKDILMEKKIQHHRSPDLHGRINQGLNVSQDAGHLTEATQSSLDRNIEIHPIKNPIPVCKG